MKIGYALTGSFCTFEKSIAQLKALRGQGHDITAIMSFNAAGVNTRFGDAADFVERLEKITGHKVIKTLEAAEPIGPMEMFDVLAVSPCTANTLSKLACGIYDTPVTLAVKSHLRNSRPVVLGVSTNDALSLCAKNIGALMTYRDIYFIPFGQDDFEKKPRSIVCDFTKTEAAVLEAANGRQIQPMIIKKHRDEK